MPITWPRAQHAAAWLIGRAWISPPVKESFEYRATSDVLALTILLTSATAPVKEQWGDRLCTMKALLEYDVEWALWCSGCLSQASAYIPVTDLAAASSAWTWLIRSRLLFGGFSHRIGVCADTAAHQGVGLSIGVDLAHRTCAQSISAIPRVEFR